MRPACDIVEALYHVTCIAFITGICYVLAIYRPIEPNLIIAGIEIILGSFAVVYAGISLARIVREEGGEP